SLVGLCLLSFTAFLDFTIVNTALPFIQKALKASVINLQWVINAFTLMLSMFMIAAGRVGDIYGRNKVFFTSVIVFGVAALCAGLSSNIYMLIAFRALQGICGAVIFTVPIAMLPQVFSADKQTLAVSTYTAITGIGLAIGPFLGGLLVGWLSWRWVFFVNVPIIVVGLLMTVRMPSAPRPDRSVTVDWMGVVLMALGIGCLVFGLINGEQFGWSRAVVWLLFIIAVAALICLYFVEKKAEHPLLDFDVLSNPMLMLAALGCVLASMITSVLLFFDPLYLHVIRQYSPFKIGLILFAVPIVQVVISASFSRLNKYCSIPSLIAAGQVFGLLAALVHVFLTGASPVWLMLIAFLLMGVNWGIANTGSVSAVNRYADPQHAGSVIGTIFTAWNIAGSIALAVSTVVFHHYQSAMMRFTLSQHRLQVDRTQQHWIASMLADPSRAKAQLSHFAGRVAHEVYQGFVTAFMSGFHAVAVFAVIVLLAGVFMAYGLAAKAKKTI
nr:MFS transporter [Gammaproteobacteria bacterium]